MAKAIRDSDLIGGGEETALICDRALPGLASLANTVSTALSQEHEVGVKWKIQRGCRLSQRRTLAGLSETRLMHEFGIGRTPVRRPFNATPSGR